MPFSPSIDERLSRVGLSQLMALALAFGFAGTLFGQYRYGAVNHLEQLPPIMRALDPGVMSGDETVDELCTFGPRYYYVGLIVALGRFVPLPAVYLLLTLAAHSATALVTLLAGRELFRSMLAAMLGAALVVSVASVGIGGAAHLVRPQLVPQTLATPLLLAALWMAFTLRLWRAVLLAAAGCLFHPLAGTHTGMLALGTCGFAYIFGLTDTSAREWRPRLRRLFPIVGAAGLFATFVYLVWIVPGRQSEHDLAFLMDFAKFRSPHHHLPSHFSLGAHAAFACFTAAMVWAWRTWYVHADGDRQLARRVGVCLLGVYLLLACGYVFVEVIPTRTFLMAQTFRLVFIVKWVGLMLIGAAATRMLAIRRRNLLGAFILFVGTGPFQPAFVLFGQVVDLLHGRTRNQHAAFTLLAALIAGIGALVLWRSECLNEILALATCAALIAWYAYACSASRSIGPILAVAACITVVALGRTSATVAAMLGPYQPVVTLADDPAPDDGLMQFVRTQTPPNAIFLTPPYFGHFRIRAERGLVVDFKCMPYDARGYQRWRERLADCYTEVYESAERAVIVMKNRYIWVTPERILHVGRKYNADYAVLYRRTPNDWPVLYEDVRYKLVAIPPSTSPTITEPSVARADAGN